MTTSVPRSSLRCPSSSIVYVLPTPGAAPRYTRSQPTSTPSHPMRTASHVQLGLLPHRVLGGHALVRRHDLRVPSPAVDGAEEQADQPGAAQQCHAHDVTAPVPDQVTLVALDEAVEEQERDAGR